MSRAFVSGILSVLALFSAPAFAHNTEQLQGGVAAIESLTGCFLVDYSYAEVESLKPGYERDPRVYEVNSDKSIKEWVYADRVSPTRVRLQHILFGVDLDGNFMDGSMLKHQVEDWEFNAPFLYDFTAPLNWAVKDLGTTRNLWTRRITNLDDGLRYQCAASWDLTKAYPEWTCANYAPIPGRETRDMGRRDYNTLARGTRVVAYGNSWLERQDNIKTIHGTDGSRTPLARELGKNWYVRLPNSECAPAITFARPRQSFWELLRQTWDLVLIGDRSFIEKTVPGQAPRFFKMAEVEDTYLSRDLSNPVERTAAQNEILRIIGEYRAN